MRREIAFAIAASTGSMEAARLDAATLQTSGSVDLHAGYGSNPFFTLDSAGASPTVGATVNASVNRITALGNTRLTGRADVNHYIDHYGTQQNYEVTLQQNQQISEFLSVSADAAYENAINPSPNFNTNADEIGPQNDLLTVGQRTRRISGDINGSWQPNERDVFQGGINGSHATFGSVGSAYDQYGGSLGYLRTINAHTKVGLQLGVTVLHTSPSPDSRTYNVGLQLVQELSAIWHLDGGISLLGSTFGSGGLSKTVGFNASLCGTYPRLSICFLGSRQSAASGFGGLRTDTQAGARVNYQLTTRSSVSVSATYDLSQAIRNHDISEQKYYDVAIEFRRDLSRRLSAGVSGRTQGRDYGRLYSPSGNTAHAYTATVNVVWKFGHN